MAGPGSPGGPGGAGGGGKAAGYTPEQVAAAASMAKAMSEMTKSAATLEASFKSQADSLAKMAAAMKEFAGGQIIANFTILAGKTKEIGDSINAIDSNKIKELGIAATESGGKVNELAGDVAAAGEAAEETVESFSSLGDFFKSKFPAAAGAAAGALSGLSQGFSNLIALGKGIGGFVSGLVGGLFNIGKSILSIPFKMFGSLMDMASQGGGGVSELAEAINGLRKEFGSLQGPTNKAIMSVSSSMAGLGMSGGKTMQIFGNMADRIKAFTELLGGANAALRSFTDEMKNNGGAILGYQKGLGLANESMEALAQISKTSGQSLSKTLNNITKQSLALGKAFGLDAKIISREIGKAAQDFKNFGNISQKQLAVAVTYAQKLGLSLDKITGTMDAFGTFDDAAENVSKLNEAFGTNIDTMGILQAETPEQKLEILRKEMAKAGVQGEKLNAQQRKLIASTTGLSDEAIIAAMSTKNSAVSLDGIQKQADKAEKKTMSQAEAMEKLADAMDRMLKGGGGAPEGKGLLGTFLSGVMKGITSSPEFIKMMMSIKQSLIVVSMKGKELGRAFVQLFPGVKQIFSAITELFNPGKIGGLLGKVNEEFKKFFSGLTTGKASFKELMANIKKHFLDFFKSNSKAGGELLGGFKKFFSAAGEIFAQAGEFLVEALAGIIVKITDWIKKPKMPNIDPKTGLPLLSPFERIFKKAGDLLWPALKDMGKAIFDKILTGLKDPANRGFLLKGLGVVAAIVLGPALLQGLIGGIAGKLGGGAASMIGGAFTKLLGGGAKKMDTKAIGGMIGKGMTSAAAGATGGPADQAAAAVPSPESTARLEAAAKASGISWPDLLKFMTGFAAFAVIGLAAFKIALEIVKGFTTEDVIKAGIVMLAIGKTIEMMAPAMEHIQSMKDVSWAALAKGLLAMAAFMVIGLGAFWVALKVVAGVPIADIAKATLVLLAMIPIFMGAGLVVTEAALIGKFVDKAVKELVVGMVAIGVAVLAMIAAVWAMNEATEGVDPAQMEAAAKMLEVMSNTFMKAGVIIGEATLIGAAIIASAGIGAAAMAAGLAAMAAAVTAMAGTALLILEALDGLKGDPGALKTKAEAFSAIMNAITELMSKVGDIMDTVAGMTSIFNTAEEDQENIKLMTTFAEKIFAGMSGLVKTLLDGLKEIKPDQAEAAKAVAGVFQAVGSLIGVVGEQMNSFQSETTSISEWFSGKDPAATASDLGSAGGYMKTVLEAIGGLITDVVTALSSVPVDKAAGLEKTASAVGSVLGAVSGMMKGIMPDPKAFQKEIEVTVDRGLFFGEDTMKVKEIDKEAMKGTFDGIKLMIGALTEAIPPLITALLGGIVGIVQQLNPQDLKALEPIGKILDSVTNLAKALMPTVPAPPPAQVEAGAINVQNLTVTFPSVGESLRSIATELPNIINVLVDAAKTVGKAAGLKQNIEILLQLFDVLPKLTSITKELGSFKTDTGGVDEAAGFKMAEFFRQIKYFLQFLFYGGKYDDGSAYDAQLAKIIDVLTNDSVKELLKKVDASKTEIAALGTLMDTLKKLVEGANMASSFPGGKVDESTGQTMADTFKQIKNFVALLFYGAVDGKDANSGELSKIINILTSSDVDGLMKKAKTMSSSAESLKGMFDVLKSIVEKTNEVAASFPKSTAGEEQSKTMSETFTQIRIFLETILGGGESAEGGEMPKIVAALEAGTGVVEALTAGVNTLSSAGTILPVFVEAVTMLQDVVATNFDRVGDMGDIYEDIQDKLTAINDMVSAIQEMENTLNSLPQINLSAGLNRVASMAGLGYGGVYTVTTKDVVVKVYLKVAMSVEEVEQVILSNNKSVIREKINLLLDATPDSQTGEDTRKSIDANMATTKIQ